MSEEDFPKGQMSKPSSPTKRLLSALTGASLSPPPVWMMRQAGRYLAEYRAVRQQAGSFLNLCFNPELAAEVTLQPVRRFGFDAAILFSDILVVPHALGQTVRFVEGEGPRLDPISDAAGLSRLAARADGSIFAPVYETVRRVKPKLPGTVTLIGFCGAPWTVATYMVAGRGTPDQAPAKKLANDDPRAFAALIDTLVEASAEASLPASSESKMLPASEPASGFGGASPASPPSVEGAVGVPASARSIMTTDSRAVAPGRSAFALRTTTWAKSCVAVATTAST